MTSNQVDEYQIYRDMGPVILTGTLAFLVAQTPLWQLTVIAALLGGLLCTEMKHGAYTGAIGVLCAWILNLLMSPGVYMLTDQIGALIFGSSGNGWIVLLIIFLIGGLFGLLGGVIGSGIRILVSKTNVSQASE